jgi:hypothetical protein
MTVPTSRRIAMSRFGPLLCSALLAVGCGTKVPEPLDAETVEAARHFQTIATAYNRAFQSRGKPPASASDLKPYLKQGGKDGKDADAMLLSPNDGKPVVIVPGVAPNVHPADDEQSIVAYEQTGVNGKRMAVDIRGMVHLVSEEEFAKIKFAGGHRPAGR